MDSEWICGIRIRFQFRSLPATLCCILVEASRRQGKLCLTGNA